MARIAQGSRWDCTLPGNNSQLVGEGARAGNKPTRRTKLRAGAEDYCGTKQVGNLKLAMRVCHPAALEACPAAV